MRIFARCRLLTDNVFSALIGQFHLCVDVAALFFCALILLSPNVRSPLQFFVGLGRVLNPPGHDLILSFFCQLDFRINVLSALRGSFLFLPACVGGLFPFLRRGLADASLGEKVLHFPTVVSRLNLLFAVDLGVFCLNFCQTKRKLASANFIMIRCYQSVLHLQFCFLSTQISCQSFDVNLRFEFLRLPLFVFLHLRSPLNL
mmetsp:Transcript_8034/g.17447  ORF Transcript_8034/g.17447 Transcript_8034/m.17447 type:complete len:202 (+) Transcript_8034:1164-1769(+)